METEEEKTELEEYGKLLEKLGVEERLAEDFESLESLINFPPLSLKIHHSAFVDELLAARSKIKSYDKYDENLFGKIEKKFKPQINEAKKAKEKYGSPAEAAKEYMTVKKNNVTIMDFSNIYLLGR
jgi:hypothetical protein